MAWHAGDRNCLWSPSQTYPSLLTLDKMKKVQLFEHSGSDWQTSTDDFPSRQTKKVVTFKEQVNVYHTISLQEISTTEHEAMWYSRSEYKKFTRSSCRQIKSLDQGKLFKDKKYCSRGLESHTRMGSLTKRKNYELSHQAVFDEQARQRREGVHHDAEDYLAYLYHSVSSSSQLWANVVGLSDQRAAEEILLEDRVLPSLQTLRQQRLMATTHHLTTSPPAPKIRAIHQATTRLRIRNIELARAA